MIRNTGLILIYLLVFCLYSGGAEAEELTIGLSRQITAIDPHYQNLASNNSMSRHIFDSLIHTDANQKFTAGLAISWKTLDDKTWEFKLREGVKFHNGADFTADDVMYSLLRVPKVPNSPLPFTMHTRMITSMEAPDPHTIIFKTAQPNPLLAYHLSNIRIMSRQASEGKTSDQIDKGEGAVGTGPYQYLDWDKGGKLELMRNDKYWGEPEPWEKITFIAYPKDLERAEALLDGDVDLIDSIPTHYLASLKKNRKTLLFKGISNRLIYLHIDSRRDKSPFVSGTDKNPLKSKKVRQAISLAINRPALAQRVMKGSAQPAGQIMPKGFFGYHPKLTPDVHNPQEAKRLLRQAGFGKGFGLSLHCPENRYINDAEICKAIAQMLTRVGIKTIPETLPKNVFFPKASKREFSIMLVGWGTNSGEASTPLNAFLATFNKEKGKGAVNRGRYSNIKLDALLNRALMTMDNTKRRILLQRATEIAIKNYAIIPLHFQFHTWATRKGLKYQPRTDGQTLAMGLKPGK